MAQGNRADSIENNFEVDTSSSSESEGVVNLKNYQQSEEKEEVTEISAFEQVMQQMNIADSSDFEKQYTQYWNEASDAQEALSLLVCEIDCFNEYNSNYGHQASSFMLLVVALALKTTCEEHGCYLARYRGNEFGILIKGSEPQTASAIAEKLRFAVEKSRTEHKFSTVSDIVTLSIGVSSVFPTSMQTEMKQAAKALNTAKMSGCNQVHAHCSVPEQAQETSEAMTPAQQQEEFLTMMKEMGINDKAHFQTSFDTTWQESARDEELLSMFICELDFFAEYVEKYGQKQANDIVLVIAMALKAKCDEIDCYFAHIEAGRFSVLIHGGNATRGLKVSETMKQTLQDLAIEHLASPVKDIATMSMGLSNIFPSDLNTQNMLMSKAESALKVAQKNGYDQLGVEI